MRSSQRAVFHYLLPARRINSKLSRDYRGIPSRQATRCVTSAFSQSLLFLHTPNFILHTHRSTPASVSEPSLLLPTTYLILHTHSSILASVSPSPSLPISKSRRCTPVTPCHPLSSPVARLSLPCHPLSHDCRSPVTPCRTTVAPLSPPVVPCRTTVAPLLATVANCRAHVSCACCAAVTYSISITWAFPESRVVSQSHKNASCQNQTGGAFSQEQRSRFRMIASYLSFEMYSLLPLLFM